MNNYDPLKYPNPSVLAFLRGGVEYTWSPWLVGQDWGKAVEPCWARRKNLGTLLAISSRLDPWRRDFRWAQRWAWL